MQLTPIAKAVRYALRPYQAQLKADIYRAWAAGARNVLAVLPTGAGKTVSFSDILHDHDGAACAIAHRQELVGQISLALARDGVYHRIIGPQKVVRLINNLHMMELGRSFFDPNAPVAVAGVDTLVRRNGTGRDGDYYYQVLPDDKFLEYGPRTRGQWGTPRPVTSRPAHALFGPKRPDNIDPTIAPWLLTVTLWVQDEAHHVLVDNKWGTAAAMFPNAKGLGVTATPTRADGKGLGRHADGVFDVLVEGPGMRDLINAGYLTDYRIFAPPSDFSMEGEQAGKSGDWSTGQMRRAAKKSQIVGDVVTHYQRIAPGKLGITFATDVETATDIAAQFNLAGIPAAIVSAKTPDAERTAILRRFRKRDLLMLVNVDLFGEGFDLPAIEVVILARPTMSFSLFAQQFGRALRLMIDAALYPLWDSFTAEQRRAHIAASTKPRAVIIDHVGNLVSHGLPDSPKVWTLDRRERRSRGGGSDAIPVRSCPNPECVQVYERIHPACPYCGFKPIPASRSGPEFVDGDLAELDAETLARLRGEVEKVDMDPVEYRAQLAAKHTLLIGQVAHVNRHVERQEMQAALRASMAWWFGYQRAAGRSRSESWRRFYYAFNIDVESAKALNTREALALAEKINNHLGDLHNESFTFNAVSHSGSGP